MSAMRAANGLWYHYEDFPHPFAHPLTPHKLANPCIWQDTEEARTIAAAITEYNQLHWFLKLFATKPTVNFDHEART